MEERQRILCVYDTYIRTILTPDPVDELWEHDIVIAHTYVDAIKILTESKKPFDMLLCQPILPQNQKAGAVKKQWYGEQVHHQSRIFNVKAFAFFITPDLTCTGYGVEIPSYQTYIVCDDCWTLNDELDWRNLYFQLANRIRIIPHVDRHSMEEEKCAHCEP